MGAREQRHEGQPRAEARLDPGQHAGRKQGVAAEADPGNHAASGAGLAYTVSNMPAAGHTLGLAKASGASDLIVWAEPNIMQSVQAFDPLLGTAPIAQLSN